MAQVTETDVTGYDYAIYAESTTATTGTTVKLPICLKNAASVTSFQFSIVLPGNLADNYSKAGLNSDRFSADNGGTVFDANKQDDGSVMALATVIDDDGFYAGDAPICYLNLSISSDMAPGEYAIVIKNTEISGIDNGNIPDKKITDEITAKLTVVDYFTLDENSTTAPESANDAKVLVKRTINANEWSTICLPFTMTEAQVKAAFGDGVKLGDFKGYDYSNGQITVNFDATTAIVANHPYIIKVANAVSEFTAEGVTINPQEAEVNLGSSRKPKSFIGNYVAGTTLGKGTLFLNDGKFWYSVGTTKIKAFRGYFDFVDLLPDFENNYPDARVYISLDGETTLIKDIQSAQGNDAVYTLDGRRVSRTPQTKGVFIQNGKKVVK